MEPTYLLQRLQQPTLIAVLNAARRFSPTLFKIHFKIVVPSVDMNY
jgi:hypothetical protein